MLLGLLLNSRAWALLGVFNPFAAHGSLSKACIGKHVGLQQAGGHPYPNPSLFRSPLFPAGNSLASLFLGWPGQLLAWQHPMWVRFVLHPAAGSGSWQGCAWVLGVPAPPLPHCCFHSAMGTLSNAYLQSSRVKPCCVSCPPHPMHWQPLLSAA